MERTPDDFTMNVKAYSLLTGHPTRPDSLWPDMREEVLPEFAGKRNVYASHLPDEAVTRPGGGSPSRCGPCTRRGSWAPC